MRVRVSLLGSLARLPRLAPRLDESALAAAMRWAAEVWGRGSRGWVPPTQTVDL